MEWIEWHHVCIRQWTQGSSRWVPLRVPRSPFIDHANTRTWNGCPLVKGDAPIRTVFYTYNIQNYFPHNACEYDPSQVCYCDTDSVIFIYDETNPKHKSPEKHKATNLEFGKGLGQWEDEFDRWVCPPNKKRLRCLPWVCPPNNSPCTMHHAPCTFCGWSPMNPAWAMHASLCK